MKAQEDNISENVVKATRRKKKKTLYIIKPKVKHIFWSEKFKTEDNRILSLKC